MIHAREDYNRIQDPLGLIPKDEPVFLLRAQDPFAADAVEDYGIAMGAAAKNDADVAFARLALRHAHKMREWPKKKAFPDAPGVNDLGGVYPSAERPTVVCLCGSTRFWEVFRDQGLKLTLEGKIVLSIGVHSPDAIAFAHNTTDDAVEIKRGLDELHKRKIDLADEVLVLNVGGYIGESTRSEIDYAMSHGKPVVFLEHVDVDQAAKDGAFL